MNGGIEMGEKLRADELETGSTSGEIGTEAKWIGGIYREGQKGSGNKTGGAKNTLMKWALWKSQFCVIDVSRIRFI